jgi:hypothetical protein
VPDLRLAPPPPRAELLRRLRGRLGDAVPGWQLLAEDVLGAETPIDFVGAEPSGRVVLVLVGTGDDDLEGVARALAQRAWLEPRVRDWLKLAPNLRVRPEAGVRAVLLWPAFRAETRAAARSLGPEAVSLAVYRFVRDASGEDVLVELPDPPRGPCRAPVAPAPFRAGITDEDLGLTREERAEFE